MMLPFLEQSAIHDNYNFNLCASESSPYRIPLVGDPTFNEGVYNVRVATFECPSHPQAGERRSATGFYARQDAVRTSYFFSTGYYTDYSRPYELTNGKFATSFHRKLVSIMTRSKFPDRSGRSSLVALGGCLLLLVGCADGDIGPATVPVAGMMAEAGGAGTPKQLMPEEHSRETTTGLAFDVPKDGSEAADFDL